MPPLSIKSETVTPEMSSQVFGFFTVIVPETAKALSVPLSCVTLTVRQYSRNCRVLMPELVWHGTIRCPLSSVRFRNSFAPANA
jgi:hypothetical protein